MGKSTKPQDSKLTNRGPNIDNMTIRAIIKAYKDNYTLPYNKNKKAYLYPAVYKRLAHWDTFISNQNSLDDIRIKKLAEHNSKNRMSTKDKIEDIRNKAYEELLKQGGVASPVSGKGLDTWYRLFSIADKSKTLGFNRLDPNAAVAAAAAKAQEEAAKAGKGILNTLAGDLTSLVIQQARSVTNAFGSMVAAAEKNVMNSVAAAMDSALSPIINAGIDMYNKARNAVFDTIEGFINDFITDPLHNLFGQNPTKPDTMKSKPGVDVPQVEKMIYENVLVKIDEQYSLLTRGMQTPGHAIGDDDETRMAKESLAREAKAVIHEMVTKIISGPFRPTGDSDQDAYVVMSLMDAAKNRINTFNYVTSLLSTNDTIGGLMQAADNYKPSSLVQKFLALPAWDINANKALNGNGDTVCSLFSAASSSNAVYNTIKHARDFLNLTGEYVTFGKAPLVPKINSTGDHFIINETEGYVFDKKTNDGLISARVIQNAFRNMINNAKENKDLKLALQTANINYINGAFRNSGNSKEAKEYSKLLREITGLNSVSDLSEGNNSTKRSSLSPDPIWGDLRSYARDGKGDFSGIRSLMRAFRVNKNIMGGEVDYFQNGYAHIFFIKPDLNLTENAVYAMDMGLNPMLGDLITSLNYNNMELSRYWSRFPAISGNYSDSNPYVSYILSNMIKSVPLTDLSLDTKEAWENPKGLKLTYGLTTYKSKWGGEISLNYYDTKNLFITNMIQMWVNYISLMKEGVAECMPKPKYMFDLDYLGAIYVIVTEPDGQSISHWARYTGVFPTSVPWSSVNTEGSNHDIPEFSVSFKYQFYETNDVNILRDFNYIMNNGYARNNYWDLSHIMRARVINPTTDITLKSGPFFNENHAQIYMMERDGTNDPSYPHTKSESFLAHGDYKFLIRFDSSEGFQTNRGINYDYSLFDQSQESAPSGTIGGSDVTFGEQNVGGGRSTGDNDAADYESDEDAGDSEMTFDDVEV